MTERGNFPISDEMLAAYLDGRLDEATSDKIEKAIENSPEMQWVVDRWLEGQLTTCEHSDVETNRVKVKPKANRFFWAIAASVLVLITVALPLFFKPQISPVSGLPENFPASERFENEFSDNESSSSEQHEDVYNDDGRFTYNCERYKSAIIITWTRQLDSARCVAQSKGRQSLFTSSFSDRVEGNHRIFVVPLELFNQSDSPITIYLTFIGSDFVCSDSISVSL